MQEKAEAARLAAAKAAEAKAQQQRAREEAARQAEAARLAKAEEARKTSIQKSALHKLSPKAQEFADQMVGKASMDLSTRGIDDAVASALAEAAMCVAPEYCLTAGDDDQEAPEMTRDDRPEPEKRWPTTMTLRVDLPRCERMRDFGVTVETQSFELASEQGCYRLNVPLPYPVNENFQGTFDVATRMLTLKLDVLRLPRDPPLTALPLTALEAAALDFSARFRNAPLPWARGAVCLFDHSDVENVTSVRDVGLEDIEAALDDACHALGVSRWVTQSLDETAAKALASRRAAVLQKHLDERSAALRAAFFPARTHLKNYLATASADVERTSDAGHLMSLHETYGFQFKLDLVLDMVCSC